MGNSSSLNTNMVWVQCERAFYSGGDTVRGVACINVVKEVKCSKIELKVSGQEAVSYWVQVWANGKSHWEPRGARKVFFKVKVPLAEEAILTPGQYQYGFVFVLPPDLPSTFTYEHGKIHPSSGHVYYKVKARCHVAGVLSSDLKHKHYLPVVRPDHTPPQPATSSMDAEVKGCWCFSKGPISATLELDKDRVAPGQQLQLRVQVDNRSSTAFSTLEVSLKQSVTLRADWAADKTKKEAVVGESLEGVRQHTTLQGGLARVTSLTVPCSAQPTTAGQIVSCDYWVAAKLKAGAGQSDIKVAVPLVIVPLQPEEPAPSEPPPGWQPSQVFDPVLVELPSSPPLPDNALGSAFWRIASGKGEGQVVV